jgi:hypothetical protein
MALRFLAILAMALAAQSHADNAAAQPVPQQPATRPMAGHGFTDAVDFGFSPEASGLDNARALQRAVDQTGTIVVSRPGTYKIAATVYVGSNTSLIFGNNVFLKTHIPHPSALSLTI